MQASQNQVQWTESLPAMWQSVSGVCLCPQLRLCCCLQRFTVSIFKELKHLYSPSSQRISCHDCTYPVTSGTGQQPLRQSRSFAQWPRVYWPAKPCSGIIPHTSRSCPFRLFRTIPEHVIVIALTDSWKPASFPGPHELRFQLRCCPFELANYGDNRTGNAGRWRFQRR